MTKEFNLKQFLYPFSIFKLRKFLSKSEAWSKEQLLEYQNQKFIFLIHHAYEKVPYYRELFNQNGIKPDDIQNINNIQIIPPLTKSIVRENFNELLSKNYQKFDPVLVQTSGSTGTPLHLYLDRNINIARFAFLWRIWNWTGYQFGQKWAKIGGSVFEKDRPFKYIKLLNAIYISSYKITKDNVHSILTELIRFQPKMLRGYPSSIYEFSKFIAERPERHKLRLNNIVTDSETLLDYQRDFIQKIFECKVFDLYSHWEHINMIAECTNQVKHHQMEYGILEILDKDNKQVKDGEAGEMTATGLFNLSMPLIRYKTGDLAVKGKNECSCGRKHDVIKRIDGRIEDAIITPDGRIVCRLDAAFKYNRGFDFAQIVQNDINSMDIFLVKNKYYDLYEEKILEKHIRNRVGDVIKMNYKFVDKINPQENGKIRFVKNNLLRNKSSKYITELKSDI